ncbi:MAG TPA: crossover junction endodeoxyribonuclease RuvC [Candidatus Limiplasma sp.]|nr:crossover junction endodeoxyribonuclease RuvC [Candidatus Limiplasma sp.]HPS81667.1 crossover junction endodeoxyribonuclease RuvC [Candidatus Limiplasma sp.]
MIVLGIDPGLATLGWGVIDAVGGRQRLIQYGCILTTPEQTLPNRLLSIQTEMRDLLTLYRPDEIAFEELFFAKNVTTAFTVGAARGVCIAVCAAYTDRLYEYTPMQVKQAMVGYGKAEKRQIQEMVKLLLHMESIARPDDAADALAIALTHSATGPASRQFMMK